VQVDPDGNLWAAFNRAEGEGVGKFDASKQTWTVYKPPPGVTCLHSGFIPQPRPGMSTMWTGGAALANGKPVTALCRFDYRTGKVDAFPLFEGGPAGPHISYQLERDSKDVAYALDFGAPWGSPDLSHYVVRLDPATGATKWFPTPTRLSFPRRGAMDDRDRYWFAEFWADNIAVFDTRAETFQEFPVGIKYLAPYFAQPDRNGDVWVSNNTSDRLIRFNARTKEMTLYLMPEYYDSRKVAVDYSTGRLVIWLGSENTAHLIRVEPLD
jgi:streptogramin lyase